MKIFNKIVLEKVHDFGVLGTWTNEKIEKEIIVDYFPLFETDAIYKRSVPQIEKIAELLFNEINHKINKLSKSKLKTKNLIDIIETVIETKENLKELEKDYIKYRNVCSELWYQSI